MSRPRLTIEEIRDPASPWMREALRLMEETFPPSERIDVDDLFQVLEEKRRGLLRPFNIHFLIARRGDELVGFCQGSYLAIENVAFVGYLAVRPELKGDRAGAVLRERFVMACDRDARLNRRKGIWAVVGEIELQNPWLRTLVVSRGALALDIPYEQPSLGPGRDPVPLVLYVQPHDRVRSSLAARDVRTLVYAIYRRIYRIGHPLRNPSFQRIAKSLEGRQRIGQRALPPRTDRRRARGPADDPTAR